MEQAGLLARDGIEGLALRDLIGLGSHCVVYRAERDGVHYAVKIAAPCSNVTGIDPERMLRVEAASLARARHPGIVEPFEVGRTREGRPYLLMEWVDGRSLAEVLRDGPLPPARVARLAYDVAAALSSLHSQQVVHRDLKPENVLLDEHGAPTLIDLGLAVDLEVSETQQVAGTFLYSAPEQTGMLHRPVDARTDLYGVGAIMFEALTGRPPYERDEVGELIRAHALSPLPDLGTACPQAPTELCAIVSRLLAKDPDDRFSDCAALRAALRPLADPAERPQPSARRSLLPARPLVGREPVLKALQQGLRFAIDGRGSAVKLTGPDGSGRSELLRELGGMAGEHHVLRLRVRAHDAPHAALTEALQGLRTGLGARAPARLRELHAALSDRLQSYAPYLLRALPEAAFWMADAPDGGQMQATQDVHYDAVAALLETLAVTLGHLVLIVDDAAELDTAGQQVMSRLSRKAHRLPLLMVATVTPEQSSAEWLSGHESLLVTPLTAPEVAELLRGFLRTARVGSRLMEEVARRTAGLPAAVRPFLNALIEEGVLLPHWGNWRLDADRLAAVALPATVEALMRWRIDQLPANTRATVRAAALLGVQIDEQALEAMLGHAPAAHLAAAVEAGVLVEDRGRYAFVTATLLDDLVAGIVESERCELHRRAAEHYDAREGDAPELLYTRARHHLRAGMQADRRRAFHALVRAGRHALDAKASCEARDLLQSAVERLNGDGSEHGSEHGCEAWRLLSQLAEAQAATGQIYRAMNTLQRACACCDEPVERAALLTREADFHQWAGLTSARTVDLVDQAWEALDEPIPRGLHLVFRLMWLVLLGLLGERVALRLGRRGDRRRDEVAHKLGEVTGTLALFTNVIPRMLYASQRAHWAAMRLGPSRQLVLAYAARAVTTAAMGLPARVWKAYLARAEELARRLGDRVATARARALNATALYLAGRIREAESLSRQVIDHDGRWLDVADMVMTHLEYQLAMVARGRAREGEQMLEQALRELDSAGEHKEDQRLVPLAGLASVHRLLLGDRAEGADVHRHGTLPAPDEQPFPWFIMHSFLIGYRLELDDLENVDREIDQARLSKMSPRTTPWLFAMFWVWTGYVRFRQWQRASGGERDKRMTKLRRVVDELAQCARTDLWGCHLDILRAALRFATAKDREGTYVLLARAERRAQDVDSPSGIFEARCLRAQCFVDEGNAPAAERELRDALTIAQEQGWSRRAARLRAQLRDSHSREAQSHPAPKRDSPPFANETSGRAPNSLAAARLRRDRDALMQVSLATARVVDPVEQARVALDELLAILGGERGVLCLADDHGALVQIAARTAQRADLPQDEVVARSLMQRVHETSRALVLSGTEDGRALGSSSAVAGAVRSMICAPLGTSERALGVVYLDNRLAKGVFDASDLDILVAIASQIAVNQEGARSAQREIARRELEKDLQLSAAVQRLLLPAERHATFGPFELVASFTPASRVAGDFWAHDVLSTGALRVLLGDVTGHGAASAMVTAAMSGCYRALTSMSVEASTEHLLEGMHRTLCRLCGGEFSMPCGALEVDPDGSLRWWSAAALPVLIGRNGQPSRTLSATGAPLGLDELALGKVQHGLSPGDRVCLFSDGVVELEAPDGRELGLRRWRKLFEVTLGLPPADALRKLKGGLESFAADRPARDDLTIVLLDLRASPPKDA